MIKKFKDAEAEKIFYRNYSKKFPLKFQGIVLRKLIILHSASSLNDLRIPPGNHLELLKGKRTGQHSIRINNQWRLCFIWQENNAYAVEIADYH